MQALDPPVTVLPIAEDGDLVQLRQVIREHARQIGLGLVPETKLITAASELARNVIEHGGGGEMRVRILDIQGRPAVEIEFEDHGPGIENIELAMRDGYSTGSGMGMGLPGAKRLVHAFHIESTPGQGTLVRIAMWKN